MKKSCLVVMTAKTRPRAEAQAAALKTNPPYPPLSGGQEKTKVLYRRRASPFHTPLTRGGRGGCLYPLMRGLFQQPRQGGLGGYSLEKPLQCWNDGRCDHSKGTFPAGAIREREPFTRTAHYRSNSTKTGNRLPGSAAKTPRRRLAYQNCRTKRSSARVRL